jgi:hypothetical protein
MKRILLLCAVLIAPVLVFAQAYPAQQNLWNSNTVRGWEPDLYGGAGGYGPFTLDASHNLNVNIAGPTAPQGGVSVVINPYQETGTARSGSVTAGGGWQQVAATNSNRRRFTLQNPCSATTQGVATSENIFVEFSATTPTSTAGAWEITPCGEFDTGADVVGSDAIWAYAAQTGHLFTAREW